MMRMSSSRHHHHTPHQHSPPTDPPDAQTVDGILLPGLSPPPSPGPRPPPPLAFTGRPGVLRSFFFLPSFLRPIACKMSQASPHAVLPSTDRREGIDRKGYQEGGEGSKNKATGKGTNAKCLFKNGRCKRRKFMMNLHSTDRWRIEPPLPWDAFPRDTDTEA